MAPRGPSVLLVTGHCLPILLWAAGFKIFDGRRDKGAHTPELRTFIRSAITNCDTRIPQNVQGLSKELVDCLGPMRAGFASGDVSL